MVENELLRLILLFSRFCRQLYLLVAYILDYELQVNITVLKLKLLTVPMNWQQIKEITNEALPSENNISSGAPIRRLVLKVVKGLDKSI